MIANKEKTLRQQYMDGDITHRQYYATVLNKAGLTMPKDNELMRLARMSEDKHLNDTLSLSYLDTWGIPWHPYLSKAFKQCGDHLTAANAVCAIKEAVRQVLDQEQSNTD